MASDKKPRFWPAITVLIAVASLNVLGPLLMLLLEKRGEVALLRASGMTWRRLRKIFLFDGFLIGCAGLGLGLLIALVTLLVIEKS